MTRLQLLNRRIRAANHAIAIMMIQLACCNRDRAQDSAAVDKLAVLQDIRDRARIERLCILYRQQHPAPAPRIHYHRVSRLELRCMRANSAANQAARVVEYEYQQIIAMCRANDIAAAEIASANYHAAITARDNALAARTAAYVAQDIASKLWISPR